MKKYLKNILLFLLLLFLYFLPTLIFKADNKYYDSLNKPFFAPKPIIFSLCWSILYIIFAILLIKILKKEFRQGLVIMGINYFISFFFIFFYLNTPKSLLILQNCFSFHKIISAGEHRFFPTVRSLRFFHRVLTA